MHSDGGARSLKRTAGGATTVGHATHKRKVKMHSVKGLKRSRAPLIGGKRR